MGLFGKSKSDEHKSIRVPEKLESKTIISDNGTSSQVVMLQDSDEVGQARDMIDQFSQELGESLAKQQSAMKRINNLTATLAKMELDLKALRRVQSENRLLNKNMSELDAKLTQKTSWAAELDSKLNDLERRHSETRHQLEDARARLAAVQDQEQAQQAQNANHERTIRALTAKFQTATDQIGHNENTIEEMQDRLDNQVSELARREREMVELRNSLEELNEKYNSKAAHSDNAMIELKNLRMDYSELKSKHVELTGELENTRYDLQTQKNVFEDTIKRRDEENMALKTRIEQLDTQIRIKENMATHLDQEFISLRNSLVNERDRAESLEMRLRLKSEEYERSAKALAKSKAEFEELNNKFAKTLDDYETLRKINQAQREKLEKYAAISGISGSDLVLNADIYSKDKVIDEAENVEVLKPKSSS